MFTTRKTNRVVQVAAVGLFSMTAVGAWAGEVCATPAYEATLMGQIEVTAPKIRLADAGHMVVEAVARSRAARRDDRHRDPRCDIRGARHTERQQWRFAGTQPVAPSRSGTVVC